MRRVRCIQDGATCEGVEVRTKVVLFVLGVTLDDALPARRVDVYANGDR